MYSYISNSENDTMNLAEKLASRLNTGNIIVLTGDLGSGKTKFVQGFLKHFNLEKEISSPTFTIVNEHYSHDIKIFHFDVYRLTDIDEFYAIGGDEYFENGICLIEWGELIEPILPKEYIKISFSKNEQNENMRILNIEAFGEKNEKIITQIKQEETI